MLSRLSNSPTYYVFGLAYAISLVNNEITQSWTTIITTNMGIQGKYVPPDDELTWRSSALTPLRPALTESFEATFSTSVAMILSGIASGLLWFLLYPDSPHRSVRHHSETI